MVVWRVIVKKGGRRWCIDPAADIIVLSGFVWIFKLVAGSTQVCNYQGRYGMYVCTVPR